MGLALMNRALFAVAAATVAGCFPTPSEKFACETTSDCVGDRVCDRGYCVLNGDGGGDGVTPVDCKDFPARHFDACLLPAPAPKLVLDMSGVYTYNTDSGTLTAPDTSTSTPPSFDAATGKVISIDGLAIASSATLRAIGTKPLIVASWSTIDVTGLIDVGSSSLEKGAGSGSNTSCAAPQAGAPNGGGGGGSGGGGFAGMGGNGGRGGGGNGGAGAAAIAMPLLAAGCPGAKGGGGNTVTNGGEGGFGGGAIQLTARLSIAIGGTVTAAGAGGGGTARDDGLGGGDGGGGGAGTGGMIGLESPSVVLKASAILAANGGGGGAGAQNNAGNPGSNGLASATAAPGGVPSDGGRGGNGSASAVVGGLAGQNVGAGGGGGGGGAAGFIVVVKMPPMVDAAAVTSPPFVVAP